MFIIEENMLPYIFTVPQRNAGSAVVEPTINKHLSKPMEAPVPHSHNSTGISVTVNRMTAKTGSVNLNLKVPHCQKRFIFPEQPFPCAKTIGTSISKITAHNNIFQISTLAAAGLVDELTILNTHNECSRSERTGRAASINKLNSV